MTVSAFEPSNPSQNKEAFLATLSHELRNPLAPILAGVDVILKSPGNPEVVTEVAAMLRRQVEQITRLIDDLLDLSRMTSGKITPRKSRVSFSDVARSAIESAEPSVAERKQHLLVRQPDGDCEIDADPQRVTQAISILLCNASKFSPAGGRIHFEATVDPPSTLRIVVRDKGKGIEAQIQRRIFEPFEQGNSGANGVGIGLSLVRAIVEMHGGSVSVTSGGAGKGSEFTMLLPVVTSSGTHPAGRAGDDNRDGPPRVLIADDGKNTADILGMFFRMEGMEAAVVYDGAEAVATARSFDPDLVCLDLGMPKMDGFEAARRIRAHNDSIVLVAISGWGTDEDRRRTAEAGFDHHLLKPVKPDDLRDVIGRYLPDHQPCKSDCAPSI